MIWFDVSVLHIEGAFEILCLLLSKNSLNFILSSSDCNGSIDSGSSPKKFGGGIEREGFSAAL